MHRKEIIQLYSYMGFTCITGLQNALERLPIVIASKSELFVNISSLQFHFGVTVSNKLLTYMIMKRIQGRLFQNAHLT